MNEQEPTKTPADGTRSACTSRALCPLKGRSGMLVWVLLLGAVLYMQWPMLKGMYYKATGAAAPASAITWRAGFDAAIAESAKTGKPILADFTASWCPPCQVMKHEVWPNAGVARAVNGGYVPLMVDVDDPANAAVAQKYGIRGIPAVLVLNAKGDVLRTASFLSADEMADFLNQS